MGTSSNLSEEHGGWRRPALRVKAAGKAGEATGQREGKEGGGPRGGESGRKGSLLPSSALCPSPRETKLEGR